MVGNIENTGEYVFYFEDLPKYDEYYNEIEYYIKSEEIVSGSYCYDPIIVNQHEIRVERKTIQTFSVKTLINVDNFSLPIKIDLLKNNIVYDSVVLDNYNNWQYVWENLSTRYRYSIEISNLEELENAGYEIFTYSYYNKFEIEVEEGFVDFPDGELPN